MSAEQISAKPKVSSEDEDLFDFPVIEMKLEGEAEPRSPMPATKPTAAEGGPAGVLGVQDSSATAVKSTAATTASPSAATTTSAAKASPAAAPTAATAQSESPARTMQASRPLLIGLAIFALINLVCMGFLWNASQALQQGLEQLRHTAAQAPQAAPTVQQTSRVVEPLGSSAGAPALAPMESFDATALRLAREEIRAGNWGAARRRLAQLLAVIDRVDPQQRAGVEADALYLSAQALEAELKARQGGQP